MLKVDLFIAYTFLNVGLYTHTRLLKHVYNYMRPGATKGTLRRENKNSFFDVCLITFYWSLKKKLAF